MLKVISFFTLLSLVLLTPSHTYADNGDGGGCPDCKATASHIVTSPADQVDAGVSSQVISDTASQNSRLIAKGSGIVRCPSCVTS